MILSSGSEYSTAGQVCAAPQANLNAQFIFMHVYMAILLAGRLFNHDGHCMAYSA